MPRLNDVETHTIAGNFSFTGARIAHLTATEYTLVDIEVDMTGSVSSFLDQMIEMTTMAVEACRKSPRSDNLLVRVATFHSGQVNEIHGYLPLAEIDTTLYDKMRTGGLTNLFDACYVSISSMNAYAKLLADQDFTANGISFIITDGDDNVSTATPSMVGAEIKKAIAGEELESHVSVLIGVNAAQFRDKLECFQKDAGLTQFIDAGDATKGKLAKLAAFVSQSVSSTSQALGTGGPSQHIAAVI